MNKQVVVIGGGVAGMTVAGTLAEAGIRVILFEREDQTGGHVKNWDRLFPNRRDAREVVDFLNGRLKPETVVNKGSHVTSIERNVNGFLVRSKDGEETTASAVVMATGFSLFDAHKKEEYGYGIYDNVITSADLEMLFRQGRKLTTLQGKSPSRVALIHCVGSRDEKVGNLYCSKVCCVTGVKQAIEIREMLPDCEVYSFYMDLRMYDRHFEELYFEAQQKWGVSFIRGRLSECSENQDHSLLIKTEDTLTGRPLKMTVDILVLLVGFIPDPATTLLAATVGITTGADRFLSVRDEHLQNNLTGTPGIFLAGAVKGPACISASIADARAAATEVIQYMNQQG